MASPYEPSSSIDETGSAVTMESPPPGDTVGGSGRYLLGDSPAEIGHLVEQAAVYGPEADELFDLIGIEPGIAAIDVGCGVMGVLHLLAERIGANGRVVGLDREPRILEAGQRPCPTARPGRRVHSGGCGRQAACPRCLRPRPRARICC